MIVGLIGKITKKEPTLLNVNVNGIIYEVFENFFTDSDSVYDSM